MGRLEECTMTDLLIRLFVKDYQQLEDPKVRSGYGTLASIVGIVCNIILCLAKFFIGVISGSVSITADAFNNLTDASSSIVTLLGFRLAQKPEDEEHPYGHARMEYLSSLVVAVMILFIGVQLAKESVSKILNPTEVAFSGALVVVLVLSILGKLWMARFNKTVGKKIQSTSLLATAADSRNDVISTGAVLLAAVVSRFSGLQLDGYIGLLVAVFILVSGVGIAKDTVSLLLGSRADEEMKEMVRHEVSSYDPRVLGIHDLMVHDYGPGQKFASIHVEVDRNEDVMVMHDMIDNIERMMLEKHHIHLTIHYDPLVVDDDKTNRMKEKILAQLQSQDPRLTLHDFRMVEGPHHTNMIFDVVVPYELRCRTQEIKSTLDAAIQEPGKQYFTVITFDSEC